VPISAVDTISLAFQHTKRQLFLPFRFWQWTRLAIVGLLAGEMGSGGGNVNFPSGFNFPQRGGGGGSRHLLQQSFPHIDPAILGGLVAVLIIAGLVFIIGMMYISSVMRFILFDSILAKECHIRAGWTRRQGPGWRYFLWNLGFMFVSLFAMAVLIGIPALVAFARGWFHEPRQHLAPLIALGIIVFTLVVVFGIAAAIVQVLTKDFVVPQMALEGIGPIEGWRRLWALMGAEKSGYAIYIGMKIVLAIGAGIVVGIASFIIALFFAVPIIGVVVAAVFAGKTAGLTWNVFTITAAIVAGCVAFFIFFYIIALISVPVIVFFPAYSIYFFAPRYRPLSLALYPPPPGTLPPPEPPAWTPTPEPAV
jgi:hypothetical protein